ncbi:Uncharacterized protein SCF082_LOCUS47804, partial [Durusdinium trenchii]
KPLVQLCGAMQENNDDWKEVGAAKVAVPPLSALLDMRVPVVEVEAGRLHAAMSWLYAAVQKLQQQHVTTSEELQQLQEQAKHAITKVDVPTSLPEDAQFMLRQQEQRRLGDMAQTEMRLQSLRASVDGCLKSSDLEALRARISRDLDEAARGCKEELASLARLVHMDAAVERRQLQESFQILRTKVEAQLELVARESRKPQVIVAPQTKSDPVDAPAGYQENIRTEAEAAPQSRHSDLDEINQSLLSRIQQLETSMRDIWQSLDSGVPAPTSPASEGPKDIDPSIMQRFTDIDKAHLSHIQRFSEIEQRLMRVETSVPVGVPKAQAAEWKGAFSELQSSQASLSQELQDRAVEVSTLRSALSELTRYISEDQPAEGRPVSAASHNKLAWLEQRIQELVAKRKGLTIEKRLQLLEEVSGSQEIFQRVKNVEHLLGKLDVDAVKEVPPQLIIVKEDQETFKQDLRREVQELKVLVGCMEACVPKETRKAIQLFKRGAGASDEEFISPQELKAHTELISMREEINGQLSEMEMNAAQRYDNLNAQVQELEMKQEKVEHLMKRKSVLEAAPATPETLVVPEGWQR